jgi:hypothetical protein
MQNMPTDKPTLDDLIDKTIQRMMTLDETTDDYRKLVVVLDRLSKMKAETKLPRQKLSPDTAASVLGTVLAVLITVGYERMHVVTSKAYGQFVRPIR